MKFLTCRTWLEDKLVGSLNVEREIADELAETLRRLLPWARYRIDAKAAEAALARYDEARGA